MAEIDSIRDRMRKNRLSYVWLIFELAKRGIDTNKSEVSSVFAGTRSGPKADYIISESESILDDYEHNFIHTG